MLWVCSRRVHSEDCCKSKQSKFVLQFTIQTEARACNFRIRSVLIGVRISNGYTLSILKINLKLLEQISRMIDLEQLQDSDEEAGYRLAR